MAFDRTKPQNTEKLKDTPALIRANWDAIAAGTDPELLITNAKVSPTAGIADTKLAQITTAGKVSGAALTSLASIPSGAGAIPVANIPDLSAAKITSGTLSSDRLDTGTTANKILKLDGDAKIPAVDGSLLTNIKPSDLAISSQARGDILYFNGTNWTRLPKGTDGQYLKIGANDPAWASVDIPAGTTQENDTDSGTAFDENETTFLSKAKTITAGKTVMLIATGYIYQTSWASNRNAIVTLKQGSTTVQSVQLRTSDSATTDNKYAWATCGIVTGISGAITFSVTARYTESQSGTVYGNLIILEF